MRDRIPFTKATEARDSARFDKVLSERVSTIEEHGRQFQLLDATPENMSDATPLITLFGWSGDIEGYREPLEIAYTKGRRVVAFDNHADRKHILTRQERDELAQLTQKQQLLLSESRFTPDQIEKALTTIHIIERAGVYPVDVIAHSAGAVHVTIAGLLRPELFRKIVMFAPAGFVGDDTAAGLYIRGATPPSPFSYRPASEEARAKAFMIQRITGRVAIQYYQREFFRAVRETQELAGLHIQTRLEELQNMGIKMLVIAGSHDTLYRADTVAQFATKHGIPYEKILADHTSIQYDEEVITHILNRLAEMK